MTRTLAKLLLIALIIASAPAFAQDVGRGVWRPTTGSFGINCNAGENTTIRSNNVQCSNTIANSTNATTATTATQAQTLNPSAQVNASQITGVIAASNLPSGGGGGGTTITCIGASSGSKSRPGSFSTTVWGSTVYSAGTTGVVSGNVPSLGSGQSTSFPISGSAYDGNSGISVSVSGTATATCNADTTFSYSNFSWSGSTNGGDQNQVTYSAGGS